MVAARLEIRTVVRELGDAPESVSAHPRDLIRTHPHHGQEQPAVNLPAPYDAFASPAGVSPQIMLPSLRPAWNRDLAKTGIVYYLQRANGDVKIGTTANYPNRRTELGRRHGPLALVALEAGYFALEAERHQQFADLRIDPVAEWFRLDPDLLDHILMVLALR